MNKIVLGLYAFTLGLYVPALLTNYFGVCPAYALGQSCWFDFWDYYESTFIAIALVDFIPLSFVADRLPQGLNRVAFSVTGAWMLILAMPDIFLSYVPWALNIQTWQYWFNEYNAYWFGDASFGFLVLNVYFFAHLTIFARRSAPKGKEQSEERMLQPLALTSARDTPKE